MNIYKWVCTNCGQISKTPQCEKSLCGKCRRSDSKVLVNADKITDWRQLLDW